MGSLFIGSDQQHTFVIFDTKTKFSAVILNEASGEHPINNYVLEESLTKKEKSEKVSTVLLNKTSIEDSAQIKHTESENEISNGVKD